jgi:hypothetical protein
MKQISITIQAYDSKPGKPASYFVHFDKVFIPATGVEAEHVEASIIQGFQEVCSKFYENLGEANNKKIIKI